jgi:hypothetical protein
MEVKISRNKTAILIDEIDYAFVKSYNWYQVKKYFTGLINNKKVYLHVEIAKRAGLSWENEIDHKNRNPFDCRRDNLRDATSLQNKHNMKRENGEYKGVSRCHNYWRMRIRFNYNRLEITKFRSKEEAAIAYNFAAEILHGEFAVYNQIPEYKLPDKEYVEAIRIKVYSRLKLYLS